MSSRCGALTALSLESRATTFRRAPGWRNWQTQGTQNPPALGPCEFESRPGHFEAQRKGGAAWRRLFVSQCAAARWLSDRNARQIALDRIVPWLAGPIGHP